MYIVRLKIDGYGRIYTTYHPTLTSAYKEVCARTSKKFDKIDYENVVDEITYAGDRFFRGENCMAYIIQNEDIE